jgi:hypothetical protein
MKRRLFLTLAVLLPSLMIIPRLSVSDSNDPPKRLLRFDKYYDYPQIQKALIKLNTTYPATTRLTSMGRSLEGRELWVLTIHNLDSGPDHEKPALYVDGNTHGNEIQGAELCLYAAHFLLTRYEDLPWVKKLVDENVFYIAPTVNPDGREAFMKEPNTAHSSRSNRRPYDNDNDGLVDEDGFDDMDGDGRILRMRKKDPNGRWKVGADPRIMVRCGADEPGQYTMLGSEGFDNDEDGRLNEDPIGGVDLNRNFPSTWRPRHQQFGAGDFPLSEPESRATVEFLEKHRHIAAIQSFHNAGNMILRPPGAEDDRNVPREDLQMYDTLGRRGERILPKYRYLQTFKDLYAVRGAFLDWGYMRYGVYSFSNEIWAMGQDYNKDGRTDELERLRWNDEMLKGKGFVPWYEVKNHPQYGTVELGGWTQMTTRIPPTWQLEEICYRNTRFLLYHASTMPRIQLVSLKSKGVLGNPELYRVTATIKNVGAMATATKRAQNIKISRSDRASIQGANANALAVGLSKDSVKRVQLQDVTRPWRFDFGNISGQRQVKIEWLVKGKGPITVTIKSEKAGTVRRTIPLTR